MVETRTVLIAPKQIGDLGAPFGTNIGIRRRPKVGQPVLRFVVHVDLDAFYASVEELDHPEYKGKPLVVGADPKEGHGRGVVTTASYEARKFGIRSAMPISEAYRRCPEAIFVFPRFDRYHQKSEEVFAILRSSCDSVEPGGIDEGYLDLTSRVEGFEAAVEYARGIQRRILDEAKLTASMGVATNKVVAKIATDMQKPFGLTAVPPGTEEAFLAPLAVRKIPGVGPKTDARLKEIGIETIAQLAALAPGRLSEEFGVWGPRLSQLAHGIDDAPVETGWERKSVGSETTFMEDTSDPVEWRATLAELAKGAAEALVSEGTLARTVTVKIRLTGFETYTRARTLAMPTDDGAVFAKVASELLDENPPTRAVRLLGVRLTGLQPKEGTQLAIDSWDATQLGEAEPWRPKQRRLFD